MLKMTKKKQQKKKKYYAVVTEDQSQIYLTWDKCREAVQGKGKKAKHKSFTHRAEAEEFIAEHTKAKEKDTEENTDAEEQTKSNGEKHEEKRTTACRNASSMGVTLKVTR